MRINCCGERTAEGKTTAVITRVADEVAFGGGATYYRYGDAAACAIHKVCMEPDGRVGIRWTRGEWAKRAELEYSLALDETMEVQE